VIASAACCLLVWFIIGMPVYFAAYKKDVLINESLKSVTTVVSSVRDQVDICYDNVCTTFNKVTTCIQVPYTCYQHYATFDYTPSGQYVVNNSTQNTELYLWTDALPTQNKYIVGQSVSAYYNMCAFTPRNYSDVLVCQQHKDVTPLFLKLADSVDTYNTSLASLAFVCLCAAILVIVGCYFLLIWCSNHPITIRIPEILIPKPKPVVVVERVVVEVPTPSTLSYAQPSSYPQPSHTPGGNSSYYGYPPSASFSSPYQPQPYYPTTSSSCRPGFVEYCETQSSSQYPPSTDINMTNYRNSNDGEQVPPTYSTIDLSDASGGKRVEYV